MDSRSLSSPIPFHLRHLIHVSTIASHCSNFLQNSLSLLRNPAMFQDAISILASFPLLVILSFYFCPHSCLIPLFFSLLPLFFPLSPLPFPYSIGLGFVSPSLLFFPLTFQLLSSLSMISSLPSSHLHHSSSTRTPSLFNLTLFPSASFLAHCVIFHLTLLFFYVKSSSIYFPLELLIML